MSCRRALFLSIFLSLASQAWGDDTKRICGSTQFATGGEVTNCLEANWDSPTANLSVSPLKLDAPGGPVSVSWTSLVARECTLTYGDKTLTGLQMDPFTVNVTKNMTFHLSCAGPGGSDTDSKTVVVGTGGGGTDCTNGVITMDFEEFGEGDVIAANDPAVLSKYKVSFEYLGGAEMKVARITTEKGTPPSFEAWLSAKCKKKPNHNRLCFASAAKQKAAGARALSTSNAMSSDHIKFRITYTEPVSFLEFDLIDFDGKENWTFTTYGKDRSPLSDTERSPKGYGSDTGNNSTVHFRLDRPNKDIMSVEFEGTKSINIFGFAFDNFVTGVCK